MLRVLMPVKVCIVIGTSRIVDWQQRMYHKVTPMVVTLGEAGGVQASMPACPAMVANKSTAHQLLAVFRGLWN